MISIFIKIPIPYSDWRRSLNYKKEYYLSCIGEKGGLKDLLAQNAALFVDLL